MKKYFVCLLALGLVGCATALPLKENADMRSNKPLILIQYIYIDPARETHTFYITDSDGKDYKVEVSKNVDTEKGIIFELPNTNPIRITKFSDGGSFTYNVSDHFPSIEPEAGKINHAGFLIFEFKHSQGRIGTLKPSRAKPLFRKAVDHYRLNLDQVRFACNECMTIEKSK